MRVYICYAQADAEVFQELAAALQRAGVEVVGDQYPTAQGPERAASVTGSLQRTSGAPISSSRSTYSGSISRPIGGADLWTCDAFIVLLSQTSLHSTRARAETRRFHEMRLGEPQRRLLPLVIQQFDLADLWPFLQEYELIEGPLGEAWSAQEISLGALQGLGATHARRSTGAPFPSSSSTALARYDKTQAVATIAHQQPSRRIPLLMGMTLALIIVALIASASIALLHGLSGSQHPNPGQQALASATPYTATLAPTIAPTRPSTATARPTARPTPTASATPLPSVMAMFVKTDTTTQGTWEGVYGAQGYAIAQLDQQLPAGVQMTVANNSLYTWNGATSDTRALQRPGATTRIASCWYSGSSFTMDITITDGKTHQLALYLLDWDSLKRSETLTITDSATGATLDSRSVSDFYNGEYLVWNVRGHVTIQVTNTSPVNAVVSGAFFA